MHQLQPVANWIEKCTFEGAVSIEEKDGAFSPWRIPVNECLLYPFLVEGDSPVAARCSGIRLSFRTTAGRIGLELDHPAPGLMLDIYVDGQLSETITLVETSSESSQLVSIALPGTGEHLVEIWLDARHRFWLRNMLATPDSQIWPATIQRSRWVHYGSSISHSQAAATPSMIWAGIAARHFNYHLTNLGFSGQCMLEPMIGRLIRDLPADLITLKLGINTHAGRLSARTFGPCAIGLIKLIREKHPDVPLVVISPIISPLREEVRITELSMTLQEMRTNLAEVVQTFQAYGDTRIHYLDGLKLFGPDERIYLPDNLHPNAEGQAVMAGHFIRELSGILNNG